MSYKAKKYMSSSIELTNGTLKKGLFRVSFWMVMSMVGKLMFFSFPLFALTEQEVMRQAKTEKKIDFLKAFKATSGKAYFETMKYVLYRSIVFLVGTLSILALGYLLIVSAINAYMYLPFAIGEMLIFVYAFTGLLYFGFLILFSLMYPAVIFLINQYPDLTLSEALVENRKLVTKYATTQILMIRIKFYLKEFGTLLFLGYLLFLVRYTMPYYLWLLLIPVGIVLYILLLSRWYLASGIAMHTLFNDLLEERAYAGLFESKETTLEVPQVRKEDILVTLFEEEILNEPVEPEIEPSLEEAVS